MKGYRVGPGDQLGITVYGHEDLDQVVEILEWQRKDSKLFGEAALELGMLTPQQRDHLLALQKESVPPLGQVLAELGLLAVETLETELETYLSSTQDSCEAP